VSLIRLLNEDKKICWW